MGDLYNYARYGKISVIKRVVVDIWEVMYVCILLNTYGNSPQIIKIHMIDSTEDLACPGLGLSKITGCVSVPSFQRLVNFASLITMTVTTATNSIHILEKA